MCYSNCYCVYIYLLPSKEKLRRYYLYLRYGPCSINHLLMNETCRYESRKHLYYIQQKG